MPYVDSVPKSLMSAIIQLERFLMATLNLAGIFVYAIVVLLCATAAFSASGSPGQRAQIGGWLFCSAAFAVLALLRLFEIEDRFREALRHFGRAIGGYDDRAVLQVPLVVLTVVGALAIVLFAYRVLRNGHVGEERHLTLALLALAGFVPLYALRTISWHVADMLLYGGSLRLNWVLDLALTVLVAGSALLFIRKRRRARGAT